MKLLLSLLQTSRSSSLDDGKMAFFGNKETTIIGNFSTGQLPIFQPGEISHNYRSLIIYLDEECSTK